MRTLSGRFRWQTFALHGPSGSLVCSMRRFSRGDLTYPDPIGRGRFLAGGLDPLRRSCLAGAAPVSVCSSDVAARGEKGTVGRVGGISRIADLKFEIISDHPISLDIGLVGAEQRKGFRLVFEGIWRVQRKVGTGQEDYARVRWIKTM